MTESPERMFLSTDNQMLLRNHRNCEASLTPVSDGCENSDSVVDKKPGCKTTGYLFVKRKRERERERERERKYEEPGGKEEEMYKAARL